ncbi:hypothetical protein [Paraburkholderia aspalathi]|uniref:hypothetical protein n=1 Tax=Paraburkholderia aspalathi TaxID=1324617 RepID=UPI0038BDE309
MKAFIAKVESHRGRTVPSGLTAPKHQAHYKVRALGERFDPRTWRRFRQAWRVPLLPNRALHIDRKKLAFSLRAPVAPAYGKGRDAAPPDCLDGLQADSVTRSLLSNRYFVDLIALCVEAIPEHGKSAAKRVDAQLIRIQDSCVDAGAMLFERARRTPGAVLGVVLIRRNGIVIGDIDIVSSTGSRVERLPLSQPLDMILIDSSQFAIGPLYWVGLQTRFHGNADLLTLMISIDSADSSNSSHKET